MAIVYVYPGATYDGDGTAGNAAGAPGAPGARNVPPTLTANNTYRFRRGTRYVGSLRPQSQLSAATTPLTLEAYARDDGTDDSTLPRPIIDHNGGSNGVGAIFVDTCANVIVRNMEGINSNGSMGGGVTVRRSQNVQIVSCVGRNSEHGICLQADQASGTSTCTDIKVDQCEVYDNVGGGITLRWGGVSGVDTNAVATAVLKRVSITRNRVYRNGLGKYVGANAVSVPCGGIVVYPFKRSDATYMDNALNANYRLRDISIEGNSVADNNGYGINVEMVDSEVFGSRVMGNEVSGSGKSRDVDAHAIWLGSCFGTLVAGNWVHDNWAYAGGAAGSGVGIFLDYNGVSPTGGTGCIVMGNRVERGFSGASGGMTPSAGIMCLNNQNSVIEGNVIVDCRQGIIVGPGSGAGTDATEVRHNLVVRATDFGIGVHSGNSTNTAIRNNVVIGARWGIWIATTGTTGSAESYNCVYGATVPKAVGVWTTPTGGTLDGTDITSDPQLVDAQNPFLGLQATSPVWRAGVVTAPGARDYFGRPYEAKPDIGAFARRNRVRMAA